MQIHRVAYQTDLLGRLWEQLGQSLGADAAQNAEEFLSYSHIATKIMQLKSSTSAWLKVYIRLSDIVVEEEITSTTMLDIMIAMGGFETFILNFVIGWLAIGSLTRDAVEAHTRRGSHTPCRKDKVVPLGPGVVAADKPTEIK